MKEREIRKYLQGFEKEFGEVPVSGPVVTPDGDPKPGGSSGPNGDSEPLGHIEPLIRTRVDRGRS